MTTRPDGNSDRWRSGNLNSQVASGSVDNVDLTGIAASDIELTSGRQNAEVGTCLTDTLRNRLDYFVGYTEPQNQRYSQPKPASD